MSSICDEQRRDSGVVKLLKFRLEDGHAKYRNS